MIHYIYRISNAGKQPKIKLDFATKEFCIENFIGVFGSKNLWILADNCTGDLIEYLQSKSLNIVETSTGNSKGMFHAISFAIKNFNEDDFVYFIEDDYIHIDGAADVLLSGLKIADYITLYDNVDYYGDYNNNSSLSPYSKKGGQFCRLFVTDKIHFRSAWSTTMTFAAKVSTLKEDLCVWKVITSGIFRNRYPYDLAAFISLTKAPLIPLLKSLKELKFLRTFILTLFLKSVRIFKKKRILAVPVPGYATHTDLIGLAPLQDWTNYKK
ncbi:MAG: hypothetical protein QM725_04425 [Lacibacter sp.]